LLTHTTDTKRFLNGIGQKENRTSNTQKGTVETQKSGLKAVDPRSSRIFSASE
jgi:hypothetical protein